jgi:hypothetical protein
MAAASASEADVLERRLLADVAVGSGIANTYEYAQSNGISHQSVVGTMKSLQAEKYLNVDSFSLEFFTVTEEGESYLVHGSPEAQLFRKLPDSGMDDAELEAAFGKEFVAISKGKCMKNKWISRDKATGKYLKLVRRKYFYGFLYSKAPLAHAGNLQVSSIDKDELVDNLTLVKAGSLRDEKVLKELKTRNLVIVTYDTDGGVENSTGRANQIILMQQGDRIFCYERRSIRSTTRSITSRSHKRNASIVRNRYSMSLQYATDLRLSRYVQGRMGYYNFQEAQF